MMQYQTKCESRYNRPPQYPVCQNPAKYRYLAHVATDPAPMNLCEDCAYRIASDLQDDFNHYRIVFHDISQPIPNPITSYYATLSADFKMPITLLQMLHTEWADDTTNFPSFREYVQFQITTFDETGDLSLTSA